MWRTQVVAKALPLLVELTGSTGPATQPAASALAILAEMHWAHPSVVGAGAVPALVRLLSQPSTEPALEHAIRALGSLVASNKYPGGREIGPRGPVSGSGRLWPEPNGSGRRGSAATGSGASL